MWEIQHLIRQLRAKPFPIDMECFREWRIKSADLIEQQDSRIRELEAQLAEAQARALPELPNGWVLDTLHIDNDDYFCRMMFPRKFYTRYADAFGSTPAEAIRNAIEKIKGE